QVYRIVNAANNVIHYTQLIPESRIRPEIKTKILAEAHFLRGFAHLWGLKYYGYFFDPESPYGIILRHAPTNLGNIVQARATVAETYDSIIADFDYCIEYGATTSESVFEASSTVAKAFLAEVLLMRQASGDIDRMLQLADEIINSGEFVLDSTFADVF